MDRHSHTHAPPTEMMPQQLTRSAEWLEPNGLGGFASGTVGGRRTRRYHALLLAATESGRFLLVNGMEAWIETAGGTFPISTQLYAPDVVHPDGESHLVSFETEPWPRWTFSLPCGTPWLLGPFVEAWTGVRGATATARREARERFVAPLMLHLQDAGLGHISAIADGDPPHSPRGCPFQVWSLGELLRLRNSVLAMP